MIDLVIVVSGFVGLLGFLAWIVEGPIGTFARRRWELSRQETIEDGQTTSECGLGGGWKER